MWQTFDPLMFSHYGILRMDCKLKCTEACMIAKSNNFHVHDIHKKSFVCFYIYSLFFFNMECITAESSQVYRFELFVRLLHIYG